MSKGWSVLLKMVNAVRRSPAENNRRRLSPRAGSCDDWAKEMVEKPDVDGDLVGLDDVGLWILKYKKSDW